MHPYRTHTCADLRVEHVEQSVVLSGWLANKRDQGGIIFAVLRDHYGQTQLTVQSSEAPEVYEQLASLRVETTVRIEGTVIARPEGQANVDMDTGEIEVDVRGVEVLGTCEVLPFPIVDDPAVGEATRLQYRFLDMRPNQVKKRFSPRSLPLLQARGSRTSQFISTSSWSPKNIWTSVESA